MEFVEVKITCRKCANDNAVVLYSNTACEPLCDVCGETLFQYRVINGYIYVLSNPRIPGLLKIGFTTRRVEERIQELNAAPGVPAPFTIEAYFATSDPQTSEYDVHRILEEYKVDDKEFFQLDLVQALSAIEAIIGSSPHYSRQPFPPKEFPPPKKDAELRITKFYCNKCKWEWLANHPLGLCPRCGTAIHIR